MFYFLADENFNGDIVRGLKFRQPALDLVRARDVGLVHVEDPDVLAWAAERNRIILTHDRSTMPSYAYERVPAGEPMPGVFVLHDKFPVGRAIEELILVIECSDAKEWRDRVIFLPL